MFHILVDSKRSGLTSNQVNYELPNLMTRIQKAFDEFCSFRSAHKIVAVNPIELVKLRFKSNRQTFFTSFI